MCDALFCALQEFKFRIGKLLTLKSSLIPKPMQLAMHHTAESGAAFATVPAAGIKFEVEAAATAEFEVVDHETYRYVHFKR